MSNHPKHGSTTVTAKPTVGAPPPAGVRGGGAAAPATAETGHRCACDPKGHPSRTSAEGEQRSARGTSITSGVAGSSDPSWLAL